MNRKKILNEMDELMSSFCQGCFLHKHNKEEKGRKNAHRFCITQCTVGEKLKDYGEMLKLSVK